VNTVNVDPTLTEAEISLRATNFSGCWLITVMSRVSVPGASTPGGGVLGGHRARRPCSPEIRPGKRCWGPFDAEHCLPGTEKQIVRQLRREPWQNLTT
jgi:hypothetical protein